MTKRVLVLKTEAFDRVDWWVEHLTARVPGLEVRHWPEVGVEDEIDYALVWKPVLGDLKRYANVKAIFSIGAGVDHIFVDPDLPAGVPITRMIDPNMTLRMTEYVVLHVLRYHRRQPEYDALQRDRDWRELEQPHAGERTVGILGLGELGTSAARALSMLGFDVAGWSRSPKQVDGVESFVGEAGFEPFLARSEIVACLLPLTEETRGILNAAAFAAMPKGGAVVNAARGGHVAVDDLIAALDSGQLQGATLDVFEPEPLPADHPLWVHPKVTITPHVAAITDPRSSCDQVAENIRRVEAGEPLLNVVDAAKGY